MRGIGKTKAEPIKELVGIRQRVTELEASQTKREQAEEALWESEEFRSSLLNNPPHPIIVINPDSSVRYVNPSLEELTGFTSAEIISRKAPYPWWTKETLRKTAKDFGKAMRRGVVRLEEIFQKKNGERFHIEITSKPVFRDGEFKYYLESWVDISERKRVAEALWRSEQKYKALFESQLDGIVVIDETMKVLQANKTAAEIFGFDSVEEAIEGNIFDFVPPEERERVIKHITEDMLKRDLQQVNEFHLRTKSGKELWISAVGVLTEYEGKVAALISFKDITERKRMEERIRELSSVVVQSIDGIAIGDLEPRLTYVNDAFAHMHGYVPVEMIGMKVANLHNGDQREGFEKRIEQVKKQGSWTGEIGHVRKDGTAFLTYMSVTLLTDDDGNPVGIAAVARDITQDKQAEQLYRALAASSPVGVYIAQEGKFVFVNPQFQKYTGLTEDELLGRDPLSLVHPEDRKTVRENAIAMLKGKRSSPYEFRVIVNGGETRWSMETVTSIHYNGERTTLGNFMDITERKQLEEEHKRDTERLLGAMRTTMRSIVMTVELRDPYTAGHQLRVTALACAIARELGLSEDRIEGLRMAAIVHDIGKLSIPAEILSKPGRLSEPEFELIKMHPQAGYDILNKTTDFPWPVAQIVLQHHERMDGSGYPAGIPGEDILLEARILGVADVVEAMSSHRPYRPALGVTKTLEEISEKSGILYDPQVVDACIRLFRERGFEFK